jgi:hypothetical protein
MRMQDALLSTVDQVQISWHESCIPDCGRWKSKEDNVMAERQQSTSNPNPELQSFTGAYAEDDPFGIRDLLIRENMWDVERDCPIIVETSPLTGESGA